MNGTRDELWLDEDASQGGRAVAGGQAREAVFQIPIIWWAGLLDGLVSARWGRAPASAYD